MFAQFIVTLFFVLAAVYARLGEEAAAADKKFNVESDGRTFLLQNFYWVSVNMHQNYLIIFASLEIKVNSRHM